MSDFATIENEFLAIEPLDKQNIFPFYERHLDYFNAGAPADIEELRKYLWMLADIGETFSLDFQHKKALPILDKVILLYEQNHQKLEINLEEEREYQMAIWSKGFSLLDLNKFFRARSYLKRAKDADLGFRTDLLDTVLKICDRKIRNRIAWLVGLSGAVLWIGKYLIKWLLPDHYSSTISFFGVGGSILIFVSLFIHKEKIKIPPQVPVKNTPEEKTEI